MKKDEIESCLPFSFFFAADWASAFAFLIFAVLASTTIFDHGLWRESSGPARRRVYEQSHCEQNPFQSIDSVNLYLQSCFHWSLYRFCFNERFLRRTVGTRNLWQSLQVRARRTECCLYFWANSIQEILMSYVILDLQVTRTHISLTFLATGM